MKQERAVQSMKKIENMNFKEAKEAFSKWEAKHPRLDGFDMGGLVLTQCGEIARGTDREAIATMLYDLFNYGFMAFIFAPYRHFSVLSDILTVYNLKQLKSAYMGLVRVFVKATF